MKSRWKQLACWERRANFIGHILHTESELMNRHTRDMFSPSCAYRVGVLYLPFLYKSEEWGSKEFRADGGWARNEWQNQDSRQAGQLLRPCPPPLHRPASLDPADTVLRACLLCTPESAPGTLCLCLSLLAPHDNWITDEGSSQKASGQYADAGRLAPKPGWPLLHPVSLKTQEGSDLYETCKRFQREKTGKACRRRWTVQSSSF